MNKMPRCYKHPDRETLVSCGRCGRALCPDCMHHGPVGVRCWDCLHPRADQAVADAFTVIATSGRARVGAAVLALLWTALLAAASLQLRTHVAQLSIIDDTTPWPLLAPNLLLAGIAGGTVGYLQWLLCGRTWNGALARWAFVLGLAMPLLSAGAVSAMIYIQLHVLLPLSALYDVRVAVCMLISALLCWVCATLPKGA